MSSLESCISVKFSLKHCNKKSDFLFPPVFLEKIIFCPMEPPSTCVVKHVICRILFPGKSIFQENTFVLKIALKMLIWNFSWLLVFFLIFVSPIMWFLIMSCNSLFISVTDLSFHSGLCIKELCNKTNSIYNIEVCIEGGVITQRKTTDQ